MKDAEILNSRLNKLSAEYENQLMSADVLAQENQSKVAELKVKPHMTLQIEVFNLSFFKIITWKCKKYQKFKFCLKY